MNTAVYGHVAALKRDGNVEARHFAAVLRLAQLASIGGYALRVTVANIAGELRMAVAAVVPRPEEGNEVHDGEDVVFDDLIYALDDVCVLERIDDENLPGWIVRPMDCVEIVNAMSSVDSQEPMWVLHGDDNERRAERLQTSWPVPQAHPQNATPLFERLADCPDTAIVFCLAAANETERSVSSSSLARQWNSDIADYQLYNRISLRFRAFLIARQRVPVSLRAEYQLLNPLCRFRKVIESRDALLMLPGEADDVMCGDWLGGFVQPLGGVLSMMQLPVAGEEPCKGFAGIKPPAKVRALDPMPPLPAAADKPIRIGDVSTGSGVRKGVSMSIGDFARHMHIIGQPGSGKTTFLVNLAAQLLRQGVGFACFSPHEDLMRRVVERADAMRGEGRKPRLLAVDHADAENPVPINVLAVDDDDRFAMNTSALNAALKEYIDPGVQGMYGERASSAFTLVAKACRALGDVSVPMVTGILVRQATCRKLAKAVYPKDQVLAKRLTQELGAQSGSSADELFGWLASRFEVINSSPMLTRILGRGANAVDLVYCMDQGMSLAVNLGGAELGVESAQFLLANWLIAMRDAMLHRRHPERPFVLIVDEAHAAAFGPLASLLDEARKFGLYVVIAHQRMGQLPRQLSDALESDAGSFIALRTGLSDASRASARLGDWAVNDLVRLPTFQAAAVICRDGVPTEPFTLFIDPPTDEGIRSVAAETTTTMDISHQMLAKPYRLMQPVNEQRVESILDEYLGSV